MATKKQKREAGEAKAKREAEERRQSGLAAQKADRERARKREEALTSVASGINQKNRSTLLKKGVNPTTGLLFTDEEMEEMRKKANTSERKHLYDRIAAGRAGTLNEQPPVGDSSDYLEEITIGDLRDKMDRLMPLFLVAPGETEAPIRKFLNEENTAANEIYGMRRRNEISND